MDHRELADHLAIRRSDTGELVACLWFGPGAILVEQVERVPLDELTELEPWLPRELVDHLQRIGVTHVDLADEFERPAPEPVAQDKPRQTRRRKPAPKTSAAPGPESSRGGP